MINRNKIILGSLGIGLGVLICIWGATWSNLKEGRHSKKNEAEESQQVSTRAEEEAAEQPSETMRLYPRTSPFYGGIGFFQRTDNPENTIPEDMIEGLRDALQRGEIVDYAGDILADYIRMSEEEILQHVRADTSGILESYFCDLMKEGAEWFLFSRDGDIMVREKTDKEGYEYVYYKFPNEGDGVYGMGLPAYGKTSHYFFIQWGDEDYLMVIRSEGSGETIDGIGVYYMLGYSLIGIVLCLDSNTDDVRFLSYFIGSKSSLPDY